MASRSAVCAVSATAKRQSSTSVHAFSGSQIIQNMNRPSRMITARSHSRHTCTDDSTASPTTSATAMAARLSAPVSAYHAPSTAKNAASAKITVTITAPLRVAFLLGSDR